MSNFLSNYLEKRRSETTAQHDGEETAQLLSSLNSNIKLVTGSTDRNHKVSTKILGAVDSQTALSRQREKVYDKFSKEQIIVLQQFAADQNSQTHKLSANLIQLNKTLSESLGKKLDTIANYLKPDNTHSKRDEEARRIARGKGLKLQDPEDKKRKSKPGSLIDDLGDVFDWPDNKKNKGRTNRSRKGRTVGGAGSSASKPSWWDKIKGKVGGVGGNISETAGKSGNALKSIFSKTPAVLKGGASLVGKLAAPVAAAIDVGSGVSDLMDGKRQTEMPSGWDMVSPMRWSMYAGEKINQGYEATSNALGGSGNMIEDGVRGVSSIGNSIESVFTHSIIPGFANVSANLGKFSDDFQVSAKGLVSGIGKEFEDISDSLKAGASATWAGAKRAAGAAADYTGNMANKAVQKITGDKDATVGSVASKLKDKALNFIPGLGGTSAQFESGKTGTKAVGWDRTGGTSYGKYQIASKTGTAQEFLDFVKQRGGNEDIHKTLSESGFAKDTGSTRGAAVEAWKKLAADQGSGERLSELEHKFIEQKKFMPAYSKAKDLGFNTDDAGVQDAIWSASVQHGKVNKEILSKVAADPNFKNMSAEDQIKAIYNRRSEYVDGLQGVSKAAGRDRYEKEVQVALAKSAEAKKKGIDAAPKLEDKIDVASSKQPSTVEAKTYKQALSVTKQTPEITSIRKEEPKLVDSSIPEEAKPVKVANADQLKPEPQQPVEVPSSNSSRGNAANTVPTLDSLPLQITDMGLVLLNIGHV